MVRNYLASIRFGVKRSGNTRRITTLGLIFVLLLSLLLTAATPVTSNSLPWFDILDVYPGHWVVLRCYNFYSGIDFQFLMGKHGTEGVDGIYVDNANDRTAEVFEITLEIPYSLRNENRIDIRAVSSEGYYYYDSFFNVGAYSSAVSTGGTDTAYAYTAYIPTFDITAVTADTSVAILTHNFPAGQTFTVRMGPYGSYGIGGTIVGTTDSGAGGSFAAVYTIPDVLKGSSMIAIRMDSPQGYYSFNYFYNNTATVTAAAQPAATPTAVPIVPATYTGFPYFYVSKVVKDVSVTIDGHNFPPGRSYKVMMGAYNTYGIGGIVVGLTDSDGGGNLVATYNIPAALAGSDLIAIRMESMGGDYAYNWFYNNTNP